MGFCCDVVFANSNFEFGSFYHPVLYSYPLCKTYFLYLFFDLSVKYSSPPYMAVFFYPKFKQFQLSTSLPKSTYLNSDRSDNQLTSITLLALGIKKRRDSKVSGVTNSCQMYEFFYRLRAINFNVIEPLLFQIKCLQTTHHPTVTVQQVSFRLVEITKLSRQLVERNVGYFHTFDF